MKKFTLLSVALFTSTLVAGCSMHNKDSMHEKSSSMMKSDITEDFVTNASIGDMFEIESSQLALQKSSNRSINTLAHSMINDHMKSSADLKAVLASTTSSAIPATALDQKHADMLTMLNNTPRADFDRAYINAQQSAHNEAVTMFETYSASGADSKMKDFAIRTLPTLQMHKQHIDTLKSHM